MWVILARLSSLKSWQKRSTIPQKTQFKETERALSLYFMDKIEKSNISNAELQIISSENYPLT